MKSFKIAKKIWCILKKKGFSTTNSSNPTWRILLNGTSSLLISKQIEYAKQGRVVTKIKQKLSTYFRNAGEVAYNDKRLAYRTKKVPIHTKQSNIWLLSDALSSSAHDPSGQYIWQNSMSQSEWANDNKPHQRNCHYCESIFNVWRSLPK